MKYNQEQAGLGCQRWLAWKQKYGKEKHDTEEEVFFAKLSQAKAPDQLAAWNSFNPAINPPNLTPFLGNLQRTKQTVLYHC